MKSRFLHWHRINILPNILLHVGIDSNEIIEITNNLDRI